MADTKGILSRIQLKYDSYANWTSTSLGDNKGANLVLKAGEIGICYLPTNSNTEQVTGTTPPQILFKVGDGTSPFSALPWASAKAADVYEWAKQASLPVTKDGTGNVVSGIAWDEATKGIKFTTTSVATSSELSSLSGRVEAIENGYATDKDLADAVSAINTAIGKKLDTETFNSFKTENTAAIGTAKSEAIAAAKTETENQVKALAEGQVAENTAAIEGITLATGSANGTVAFKGTDVAVAGLKSAAYTEASAYATAEQGEKADSAVQSVSIATGSANGKVKLTVDGSATEADVYGLKSAAYSEASAFDAAGAAANVLGTDADDADAKTVYGAIAKAEGVKSYADQTFATIATLDKYALVYDSEAKKFYLADETGAAQGTGIDATPFIKDGMLENVEYSATDNTLTFTWNTDGGSKTDTVVLSDILDPYVAVDTDTIDMTVDGVNISAIVKEGSIAKTHLASALAIELDAKATEADLTLAENRIKALEDKSTTGSVAKADVATAVEANGVDTAAIQDDAVTAAKLADDVVALIQGTKVDSATDADKLGGKAAADYALKTDAQGYANTAESNAKGYADGLASNYATAAQGAKADSALQAADIVSGSANGTIAVKGTDVAVKGLGSAAYTEAGAYATSAQGAKADTALQSVAVGTGLTVTEKADGSQTIGISEEVIFVINCGTSTTVIE